MAQLIMPISDLMKENVAIILNEDNDRPSSNGSSINITKRPKYGSVKITCTFYGDDRTTGEHFELTPIEVTKYDIDQNFDASYTDNISLSVSLMPYQYLRLFDNSVGLKCRIEITSCDRNYAKEDDTSTFAKEYLALFKNKTDIRKQISKDMLSPDTDTRVTIEQQDSLMRDIEFQLIEQLAYDIRKVRVNFILTNASVKSAILYLCKVCKINTIAMIEPDNKRIYNNLIIPPTMTFDETMMYLQDYYGVYNKGMSYYLTENILYIYPMYETNPSTRDTCHLYYVGNQYTGSEVNHAYSEDICHIILSEFSNTKDMLDTGIENVGTTYIIQDADRIVDIAATIGESSRINNGASGLGKMHINELNTSVIDLKDITGGATYDAYNPKFVFDYCNPYTIRSKIHAFNRAIVVTSWPNAVPFTFKPGHKLYYHYDSEDVENRNQEEATGAIAKYTTKTGTCSAAIFKYRMCGRIGTELIHSCEASIILSIESDKPNKKPTASLSSVITNARSTKEFNTGGEDTKALITKRESANSSNSIISNSAFTQMLFNSNSKK